MPPRVPRPGSPCSVPRPTAPVHLPLLEVAISGQDTDSARLFWCRHCQAQSFICRRCDRGQAYCSRPCQREARRVQLRAAERRYRASGKGRRNNAARQCRHRERLLAAVTHQGSASRPRAEDHARPSAAMVAALAQVTPYDTNDDPSSEGAPHRETRCCACGEHCSPFVRKGFLSPPTRRDQQRNRRPRSGPP